MDKRKFLSKLYIVLLTSLLILPCSKDVNGADWIWFDTGLNNSSFFYDADILSLPTS